MLQMHLKQSGFTYSACGPFTKNEERIGKFMETGNTNLIYQVNLIKLVFNMIWLMANQKNTSKKRTKRDKKNTSKKSTSRKRFKT